MQLAGGGTVKADEAYIRESILEPQAKIVSGFEPVMPTFQGLVTEEQVVQLIEYVKSLGPKPGDRRRPMTGEGRQEIEHHGIHSRQALEPYDYRSGTRTRDIT